MQQTSHGNVIRNTLLLLLLLPPLQLLVLLLLLLLLVATATSYHPKRRQHCDRYAEDHAAADRPHAHAGGIMRRDEGIQ